MEDVFQHIRQQVTHSISVKQRLVDEQVGATTFGSKATPGEPLASEADLCLCVRSAHAPRNQQAHILPWDNIYDLVEGAFTDAP